jgi:hypothetical protein
MAEFQEHLPISYLLDEQQLRQKYQEALSNGASEQFAKAYIREVAQGMMVAEAMTIGFRPEALNVALDTTVFRKA